MRRTNARIFAPVAYSAWMGGDLGDELERMVRISLDRLPCALISRLPRGFIVEANEDAGPLVEAVHAAMRDLEQAVSKGYPVFHREMGPVWSGTLQVVFLQD